MSATFTETHSQRPVLRLARAMLLAGCLALPGCTIPDIRGDKFPEDDWSGFAQQVRPRDTATEAWGATNKALQIEQNLGVR